MRSKVPARPLRSAVLKSVRLGMPDILWLASVCQPSVVAPRGMMVHWTRGAPGHSWRSVAAQARMPARKPAPVFQPATLSALVPICDRIVPKGRFGHSATRSHLCCHATRPFVTTSDGLAPGTQMDPAWTRGATVVSSRPRWM